MCINFLPQPLTQAGISQIYDMQNIYIKIPFVLGSDWPLPSRSNTTLNQISFIPGSIIRVNTQPIADSSVYLDCFIILPVSRSITSAHTYMPRLLHSLDCSTVSTLCTDTDLGSRVYIGIYRFSGFLPQTDLEGDIGMTMSACCPSHFWIFCAFADKRMIMGLHRPDKLWSCSAQALLFPGLWSVNHFRPLGQTNGEPPQPVFTSGHPSLNSYY